MGTNKFVNFNKNEIYHTNSFWILNKRARTCEKKNKKIYSKIKQTNRQKSGLRTPKEGKIKNQNYLVAKNPQANEIEQSPINSGVRDSASLTTKFHRRPIN